MPTPARPEPILNPLNYTAPKPVWFLVCIKDPDSGRIYSSRWSDYKCETPVQAFHSAYGRGTKPSGNVLFFELGSTLIEARKLNRAVAFHQKSYEAPNDQPLSHTS